MSNKKLTFEQAVRSGKDFRCVESGVCFTQKDNFIYSEHLESGKLYFRREWLYQTFEIIEVKKELTASEIEEALAESFFELSKSHKEFYVYPETHIKHFLKKLGF